MSKLLKGFKSLLKAGESGGFDIEGRFDRHMTLKFVFVGGHQSGKSSIVNALMKKGFSKDYCPTIGIDTQKFRLHGFTELGSSISSFMEKTWVQLWDVSHAELNGVHESLIFHEAHAVVIVADLTSFASIEAVDLWLRSLHDYLSDLTQTEVDDSESNDDDDHQAMGDSKVHQSSDIKSDDDSSLHKKKAKKHTTSKKEKKKKKKHDGILMPRVYLLINKYDLSDDRILTDSEIHKFCKSNCIRAWGRVSAKLDRRNELVDMIAHFARDVLTHLPAHMILRHEVGPTESEESDRTRYARALEKSARRKIAPQSRTISMSVSGGGIGREYINDDDDTNDNDDEQRRSMKMFGSSIFDASSETIGTFDWSVSPGASVTNSSAVSSGTEGSVLGSGAATAVDDAEDSDSSMDSTDERFGSSIKMSGPSANSHLSQIEDKARQCLKSMHDAIKVERMKADASRKSSQSVTVLKLEMLRVLESELVSLTRNWEDELNTVAELISFNSPLVEVRRELELLNQEINARRITFQNRLRLVHNLRIVAQK